jgi:hypothetical protein
MQFGNEARYSLAQGLATRLSLPYDPEEGFVFNVVNAVARAFERLDADEAWRYLEAHAIRMMWWHRQCPKDDCRSDADAKKDARWFWRAMSIVNCEHAPRGSACDWCLSLGRGSFRDEAKNDGFPAIRSEFVERVLMEVVTPYLGGQR